jgi:hypothetical protein
MSKENMTPEQLSDWMKREREILAELTKVLRQHIAVRPEANLGDWVRGLRAGFDRLVLHLQRHYAAKQEDGYLSLVLEQRPTLSKQVERLRLEHEQILHLGTQIQAELASMGAEQYLRVADACERVERFMSVAADHDQREIMITMFVFSQDMGLTG